jgi:hypothetical protein
VSEFVEDDQHLTAVIVASRILASVLVYAVINKRLLTRDARDMSKARRRVAAGYGALRRALDSFD